MADEGLVEFGILFQLVNFIAKVANGMVSVGCSISTATQPKSIKR